VPVQDCVDVRVFEGSGEAVHGPFTGVGANCRELLCEERAVGVERLNCVRPGFEAVELRRTPEITIEGVARRMSGDQPVRALGQGRDGDLFPGPVEGPDARQ
jgi:hypothetical protein